MKPVISIIVPVYNVEKYLPRCIDSILRQTIPDFELILVDDGSPDGSGVICDQYACRDRRIAALHKLNGGVSSARNAGLRKASGKYICFIDSDDTVDSNYLETMLLPAVKYDADLVICGLKTFSSGRQNDIDCGCTEGCFKHADIKNVFLHLLNCGYLNYAVSKLYRTELIKKHQVYFDELIDIAEDTTFVLEVLKNIAAICVLNAKPYNYYLYGSTTLTHKFRKSKYEILLRLHRRIEQLAKEWNLNDHEHRRILLQRYFDFAIPCLLSVTMPTCSLKFAEKIKFIKAIYDEATYKNNTVAMDHINLRVSNKLKTIIKTNSAVLLLLFMQIHNWKIRLAARLA